MSGTETELIIKSNYFSIVIYIILGLKKKKKITIERQQLLHKKSDQ